MHEDDNARIWSLFWDDARSRASYEKLDNITFDTIQLKNKYDMPFAPFAFVNHHGNSILATCIILSILTTSCVLTNEFPVESASDEAR